MRECVVVLGMHRSGTSVLTGLISFFGGYVGFDVMSPTKDNPKGYFENNKIYLLNEKILRENNASWDDYSFVVESIDPASFEKYIIDAKVVIENELKYVNKLIIKDPRLCILFPIWERALTELDIEIKVVLSYRSPVEVSHSLLKRDQIAIEKGLMIWSHYFLQSELYSRKYKSLVVEYDKDFKDLEGFLGKIGDFTGLKVTSEVIQKANEFYTPSLKHHQIDLDNIADDLPTYLNQLVIILRDREFDSQGKLDVIRNEFKNSKVFYLHEYDQLTETNDQLTKGNVRLTEGNTRLTEVNTQLIETKKQLEKDKSLLETKIFIKERKIEQKKNEIALLEVDKNKVLKVKVEREADLSAAIRDTHEKNRRVEHLESNLLTGNKIFLNIMGSRKTYKKYKRSVNGSFTQKIRNMVTPFKKKNNKRIIRDKSLIMNSGLFSHFYYLSRYSDVWESEVDPLEHYCRHGWKEGRNPSAFFNTSGYLDMYPDVARSLVNPLVHYIQFGESEGRVLPKSSYSILEPRTVSKNNAKSVNREEKVKKYTGDRELHKASPTVLLVAHSAGDLIYGGERSFFDMVRAASMHDCNVVVVLPRIQQEMIQQLKPFTTNILVLKYGWWRKNTPVDKGVVSVFMGVLADFNVSLVHVNTIMLREVLLAAKKADVTSVIHIRELITGDETLVGVIGKKAEDIVLGVNNSSDYIIANSQATAKAYGNNSKTTVIHNTVDTDLFNIENKIEGVLKVGLISSNIDKKGVFEFVEIAEKCIDDKGLQFVFIGPISSEIKLIEEIILKKELTNIFIAGYSNTSLEAVSSLNIILNISKFTESFGRTVLEAMAARRPVIAYSWGAVPELIDDGKTGYLVPYMDTQMIAEKLRGLDADRKLIFEMGEAARERAIDKFGFEVYAEKVSSLYRTLLDAPKALDLHDTESKRQKIAYFLWHFPVPSETFVLNELRVLVDRGYDVIVFCKQSPFPDFEPDFAIHWEKVASPKELANKLKKTERTIVHSHFTYPTVTDMVWPACELAKVNFTFIAHAQDIFKYENIEKNRIGDISNSPFCKNVLVPSRYHREFVIEQGVMPSKILINPNGIDPNLYAENREDNEIREANYSVCAIHRYTEKKGLENLILSAPLLENKNIEINIYGYGELEEVYLELIKKNKLTNVHIHGAVKGRHEMLDVFSQNDVFLCPSVRAENGDMDGIPTVLMEAMAYGIPVISTKISGIPDLITDKLTGFITEASPQGVANTLNEIYKISPQQLLSISKSAKELIYKNYNSIKLVNNLVRAWSDKTSLDIIIVSWNNLPELKEVIRRIQKYTLTNYKLLICDNNSEEDVHQYLTELQLQFENVKVYFNPNNSMVGPGSNIAIDMGSAEYIIYVCGKEGFVFDYKWEQNFIDQMDDNPMAGLGGTLCYSPTYLRGKDYPTGIKLFDQFRNKEFAVDNPNKLFSHIQGGFFILRRKMYNQIGGFSEEVSHNSTDVEYSYYAESCGWQLIGVEGMVSLYNKSRPTIFSRLDESIVAIHPPTLEQLPLLEQITQRKIFFCNICEGSGKNALKVGGCPQCGSQPDDRTLYRYLAESTLTYRRLAAISIDLPEPLSKIWQKQFQGESLTVQKFKNEIKQHRQLGYSQGGMNLFYYKNKEERLDKIVLKEASRLLESRGVLLVQQSEDFTLSLKDAVDDLSAHGFDFVEEVSYSSAVVEYGWNQFWIFEKNKS